jgi:hypothetical protein
VPTTNDGDTFRIGEGTGEIHTMQMIDASQFAALSGPAFLTRLSRRPDRNPGPTRPGTATTRIYALTTSRSLAAMSTTFSQNTGTNRTLVFDGAVTLATENLPGPGNTRQFDIAYACTTPFLYDPADGNLLLEFQIINGGPAIQWDALTADSSVRTILAPGSATAPTGDFRGSAVVTFAAPATATIRACQMEVCWNSQSNATY